MDDFDFGHFHVFFAKGHFVYVREVGPSSGSDRPKVPNPTGSTTSFNKPFKQEEKPEKQNYYPYFDRVRYHLRTVRYLVYSVD